MFASSGWRWGASIHNIKGDYLFCCVSTLRRKKISSLMICLFSCGMGRGEYYPGAFQFMLELGRCGVAPGRNPLKVAVLTARAREFKVRMTVHSNPNNRSRVLMILLLSNFGMIDKSPFFSSCNVKSSYMFFFFQIFSLH